MKTDKKIVKSQSGRAAVVIKFAEDDKPGNRGIVEVGPDYHTGKVHVFWYTQNITTFTAREFQRLYAEIDSAVEICEILNS